ncbi:hypothetical protein BDQ17DRAFT_1360421 [Cyathus striatus]|nr:hypothetical protein BDQ17DRAFT_1360421 [Cyathus striatus]
MSPRPILKRAGSNSDHPHHHAVHFPQRGCPGRTYTLDEPTSPPPSPSNYGRSFAGIDIHSRAYAFASSKPERERERESGHSTTESDTLLPPLVPDTSSSESDESDGFIYPPQDIYSPEAYHVHGLAIPASKRENGSSDTPIDMSPKSALSFLPYSSSSPINNSYFLTRGDALADSRHRRKPSRERKHESSQDPGRIPCGEGGSPPRRSKKRSDTSFSVANALSSMSIDDGCLGGF